MMKRLKNSNKGSSTYKIYWHRVAMVAMVPILAIGLYNATFPSNVVEYEDREVIVQNGDTLWTIAKYAVGESEDVRQTIREIMTTNKLQDGTIHPGMTLKVRAIKE